MSIILNAINYFWKLGFNEEVTDLYVKNYSDSHRITIDVANEVMDYGKRMRVRDNGLACFSQMNFVIIEAIDRALRKGYQPEALYLGRSPNYHYAIEDKTGCVFIALKCYEWEEEYDVELAKLKSDFGILESFFKEEPDVRFFCAYTSRLKAGTIECRYLVFPRSYSEPSSECYSGGLFEEDIQAFNSDFDSYIYSSSGVSDVEQVGAFHISNGILINYTGNSSHVVIPEGVEQLRNGVFWNCLSAKKITIPDTVKSLGGDTFYNCENLTYLTIPSSVVIMGDNPFANCPKLNLVNKSPHFVLDDGGLYTADMSRLIYCAINRESEVFKVPDGVISVSKHSFYNCKNLRRIIIPPSVRIMENNPFSNLPDMRLENNSPHFIFKDGALYNKTMSTLFYYEHGTENTELTIPEGVKIIGRHSFYSCQTIEKITIPRSVNIVGYNPFTNCLRLSLENHSSHFIYENGTLYNKDKTVLIYHSIQDHSDTFFVPDSVRKIGRSAFFNCTNLREVVIPDGVSIIDRSAFANCSNLEEISIPESMETLGEWAFLNCSKLKEISIPKKTIYAAHTFLGSFASIILR